MSAPPTDPSPRRRVSTTFTPRFTLSLFYLFGFFFLFALLLVVPALVEAFQQLPAESTPQDLEIASEVARETLRPRLGIAVAGSLLATALGAYTNSLPGMRA